VFDELARVLLQILDGVGALVGAVVPKPGQRIFGRRVDCGGGLRRAKKAPNELSGLV